MNWAIQMDPDGIKFGFFLKELVCALQLDPLNNIKMESCMVYYMGYHKENNMELYLDLQMELQMESHLDFMN